jgi:hypothetical protein
MAGVPLLLHFPDIIYKQNAIKTESLVDNVIMN